MILTFMSNYISYQIIKTLNNNNLFNFSLYILSKLYIYLIVYLYYKIKMNLNNLQIKIKLMS